MRTFIRLIGYVKPELPEKDIYTKWKNYYFTLTKFFHTHDKSNYFIDLF